MIEVVTGTNTSTDVNETTTMWVVVYSTLEKIVVNITNAQTRKDAIDRITQWNGYTANAIEVMQLPVPASPLVGLLGERGETRWCGDHYLYHRDGSTSSEKHEFDYTMVSVVVVCDSKKRKSVIKLFCVLIPSIKLDENDIPKMAKWIENEIRDQMIEKILHSPDVNHDGEWEYCTVPSFVSTPVKKEHLPAIHDVWKDKLIFLSPEEI